MINYDNSKNGIVRWSLIGDKATVLRCKPVLSAIGGNESELDMYLALRCDNVECIAELRNTSITARLTRENKAT